MDLSSVRREGHDIELFDFFLLNMYVFAKLRERNYYITL